MTEISFARSFLSALDMRPSKISSDHVTDPKTYAAQTPTVLPKLPSQSQKRKHSALNEASTSSNTVTVSLKALKGVEEAITLPRQALSMSMYDLKTAFAARTSIPTDKIRLLYAKKPVGDSKTVGEVAGSNAGEVVEFGVMIMGGAVPAKTGVKTQDEGEGVGAAATKGEGEGEGEGVSTVPSAKGDLKTDQFWEDLSGFLTQRLKDQAEGQRLAGVFRDAWRKDG